VVITRTVPLKPSPTLNPVSLTLNEGSLVPGCALRKRIAKNRKTVVSSNFLKSISKNLDLIICDQTIKNDVNHLNYLEVGNKAGLFLEEGLQKEVFH
jgi:hypothetical protein